MAEEAKQRARADYEPHSSSRGSQSGREMERWDGIFFEDKEPTKLSHRRNIMGFKEMSFLGGKNLQMFTLV